MKESTTIKVWKSTHEKALLAQSYLVGKRLKRMSLTEVYDELISAAVKQMGIEKIDSKK